MGACFILSVLSTTGLATDRRLPSPPLCQVGTFPREQGSHYAREPLSSVCLPDGSLSAEVLLHAFVGTVLPGIWNPHGNQRLASIHEAYWLMTECSHFGLGVGLAVPPANQEKGKSNADLLPT